MRGAFLHRFQQARALVAIVLALASATAPARGLAPVKSLLEMRQERVVVQQWDLSCGAAALATILKYQYGEPVSEREIARALVQRKEYIENPSLVTAREGFSLLDLKRVADARGYKGLGLGKVTLQSLIEKAPAIVPISVNGYNHFVVFRGIRGDQVLLADPAWGNRTLSVEAFERAWIEFPELGRLAFAVAWPDGAVGLNRLAPRLEDFVLLR